MDNRNLNLNIRLKTLIANKFLNNTLWTLVGSFSIQLFLFLLAMYTARTVGKFEYGRLSILTVSISLATVILGVGISTTLTNKIASQSKSDLFRAKSLINSAISFHLFTGTLFVLLIMLFSKKISLLLFSTDVFNGNIVLSSIIVFVSVFNSSVLAILNGLNFFSRSAINNLAGLIISIPIGFFLISEYHLVGALITLLSYHIIVFSLNSKTFFDSIGKLGFRVNIVNPVNERLDFFKFSVPSFLSTVLLNGTFWTLSILILKSQNGTNELASFNLANSWRNLILFLPNVLVQVLFPRLSFLAKSPANQSELRRLLNNSIFFVLLMGVVIMSLIYIFSERILSLFGQDFTSDKFNLLLISFSAILTGINAIVGVSVLAIGSVWSGFMLNLFWAFITIMFAVIFLQLNCGSRGVIYSLIIGYLIHTVIVYIFIKRKKQFKL